MDSVYIPSRGRSKTISTHKHFQRHGAENWYYVVEPFDYVNYVRALRAEGIPNPERHVIIFDVETYKSPYHEYSNPKGYNYEDWEGWKAGETTGPGPARNALIDMARERGETHCWMLDDDILGFSMNAFHIQKGAFAAGDARLNVVEIFELYERLLDKYVNIGTAEMDKQGINTNHKTNLAHLTAGTKTYSCIRINTAIDVPWRGRWNDDVIYSLDYLWAGYVNLSSKIISYLTPDSQSQAGGMTSGFKKAGEDEELDEIAALPGAPSIEEIQESKYAGTLKKAKLPQKLYPSVAHPVWKYSRPHHEVAWPTMDKDLVLKDGTSLDDLFLL